jgi:hypothetical protein
MVDFYKSHIPIIDVEQPEATKFLHPKGATYGLVPRDYEQYPESMFASPSEMELIPESEWDARFDEQERLQSSLEHLYLSGPNGSPAFELLDQNGHGYCWAYSTAHAIMLDRLRRNVPTVRLNPHATAAIIKRGRDEGGWCGLSAKWGRSGDALLIRPVMSVCLMSMASPLLRRTSASGARFAHGHWSGRMATTGTVPVTTRGVRSLWRIKTGSRPRHGSVRPAGIC